MCGQHRTVGLTGVGTGAGAGVLGLACSAQRAAGRREGLHRFPRERDGGYQETR